MPVNQTQKDRWGTKQFLLEGGTINNEDLLYQGETKPGSLLVGTNFETALLGGYRRISGYTRYNQAPLPGTGQILGSFVFETGVIAMRGTSVQFASTAASAWTDVTGTARGAGKYRAVTYNWSKPTITFVNGSGKAAKFDSASTYTDLASAPSGASYVAEFKRYLWLATDNSQTLTFSAPGDDTNYDATAGAGAVNVGFGIHGLGVWRDELYVFGRHNISRISGTSAANWALSPVTNNIGCVAPDSIREVGGDLVYLSSDGIRTIAGTMRIGDVDIANLSRPIQKKAIALIPFENYSDGAAASVVVRSKSQYRVWGSRSSVDRSIQGGLIGSLRQSSSGEASWEWFDFNGAAIYSADSNYLNNETELVVHTHNDITDNYVYKQESGSVFTGFSTASTAATTVNITWNMQFPYMAFDDPRLRKTLYRLCAYIFAEGNVTLNTGSVYDFNDSLIVQPIDRVLGTVTNAGVYDDPSTLYDTSILYDSQAFSDMRICVQLEGSALAVSFIIYGTGGAPFTIRSMSVEYALNGRR